MTYRGRIQNGVVVFDEPVKLVEGARVEVVIMDGELPTLNERFDAVIGKAQGLPSDGSLQVDHYLCGHPLS